MIDTGERMIPKSHKGQMVYGEHIVRYEAVVDLVKDKNILDIACGSGYGSKLLSTSATSVVGVDISKESIEYAKSNYDSKNITYKVGSATSIPAENNQFDAVISFETIEHIDNYQLFLKEVRRVLKKDGVFVVSTPNDDEFSEANEFHLHEFRLAELKTLLTKRFKYVNLYYQGTWLYNALLDEKNFALEWSKSINTHKTLAQEPTKAIYFVAVCSDSTAPNIIQCSAISEPWSLKVEQQKEKANRTEITELKLQLKEVSRTLSSIYSSRGWLFLTRLRKIRRLLPF